MQLFEQKKNLSNLHVKVDKQALQKVPSGMWINCPKCHTSIYHKDLSEYKQCPTCYFGFRIKSRERLNWLVDDFTEIDEDIVTTNPLNFPNYEAKLEKGRNATHLNDSVLTGFASIEEYRFGLGIMDPYFIMGSLGTVTGEKITRLFEKATENNLPVILFTASGGARMQEGIMSLMQMAKVSQAIADHGAKGLPYIVILTDPTTGGVTASFAMQADITLAEPHTLIGFAGRRVIEQTMHQKIPDDLQEAETLLKNGFLDGIVRRDEEKTRLEWLLRFYARRV